MALLPAGTLLTIYSPVIGTTITLVVDSITDSLAVEPFDRIEFTNERQRTVRTTYGEKRLLGECLTGKPFQIVFNCMSDLTPVPLVPDSNANYEKIKQKWVIKRYQVQGAMSNESDVNNLYNIAHNHQDLLTEFQYHIARASADTAYSDLIALQSDNFSYITSTGTTVQGSAMAQDESNVLITQFSESTELAIGVDNTNTNYEYYKTYNITFEIRTLASLNAIT